MYPKWLKSCNKAKKKIKEPTNEQKEIENNQLNEEVDVADYLLENDHINEESNDNIYDLLERLAINFD